MAIRALSTAATGMISQQQNVDVISNNIANVNTTGYKRSRANFEDLLYQQLQEAGVTAPDNAGIVPAPIEIGLGSRLVSTAKIHTQGPIGLTENPLDLAIDGDGFFRLLDANGSTVYSRDGSFKVDRDGNLVNNNGLRLADGITIPQNATSITVSTGGIVTAHFDDNTTQQIGQMTLSTFINPAGLNSLGNNLFAQTEASGAPIDGNPQTDNRGQILQGALEESNVQVVTELVNLIRAQRAFEINSNSIQVADQMLQVVNNLRS